MERLIKYFGLPLIFTILVLALYINGCSDSNNSIEPAAQTDDEYLSSTAINTAFSSESDDDDNLFASEVMDFDSDGPVGNGGNDSPIDSLLKWGRRVTGVNLNTNITSFGDTLKNVEVKRTVTGNFIIIGYIGGILDSTVKPYTQEQRRLISFKRTGRGNQPRNNWRVYQYSAIDGETKNPEIGKDNITVNKVEIYRNGALMLTLNGPDFTSNIFTSRYFDHNSLFDVSRGDEIRTKVYLTSNQSDTDIVAYHWARNSFGFHREMFRMTSQMPNGTGFDRIYEKAFDIYNNHLRGIHNAFISADTRSSLYDNSISLFSSTYLGLPYRVRP